jgi:hypothetical protein
MKIMQTRAAGAAARLRAHQRAIEEAAEALETFAFQRGNVRAFIPRDRLESHLATADRHAPASTGPHPGTAAAA